MVVPFDIACGDCYPCSKEQYSACDNSNPNASLAAEMTGYAGAAAFGYTKLYGHYAGGQAEYARVPYADFGPLKVPDELEDEDVLFLSDIFPTGFMAADNADIEDGDTVAIWGCGPVGQFAVRSAFMLGAERVIAIDRHPSRLRFAEMAGAETLNYESTDDMVEALKGLTAGRGARHRHRVSAAMTWRRGRRPRRRNGIDV